ncbi:MAG: polysaccharide deacetylase family protein [Verrucomicrobiota bacterium]
MDSPSSPPALVVSLHDAHPGSIERIRGQLCALRKWGVERTSILMVPEWHHGAPTPQDPRTVELATGWQREGHELVLHGYFHDRVGLATTAGNLFWTRLYTNQEAEFLDLTEAEAAARLKKGRALFGELGWAGPGFIAPAWLMAPHLPATLRQLGFAYTNTLRHFLPLGGPGDAPEPSQSLCWSTRASWRRTCSLAWNARLLERLLRARPPLLRISLHPDDLTFAPIREQIERSVKRALQSGYKPTSYADYAAG